MLALSGKKFLITGASSGIGACLAHALAAQGCHLVLSGRNKERLDAQVHMLSDTHGITADISKQEECERLLQESCSLLGPLDGMAHCAGISLMQPMRFYNEAETIRVFESNLLSAFHLVSAFRKRGRHTQESRLVMMSSVMAQHGVPSLAAYSASKAGLEGAVRAWAMELARESICINALAPSYVLTPMFENMSANFAPATLAQLKTRHPFGFGRPEDVAHVAMFLLSPLSRWINGVVLPVDGGFHAG